MERQGETMAPGRITTGTLIAGVVSGAAVLLLVLAIGGLVAARALVFDWLTIPQDGMAPSLPAGATLLLDKRACRTADDVRRGDIVAFRHTLSDGREYTFVWRAVGLPGEEVVVSGHEVTVDGRRLEHVDVRRDGERWTATEVSAEGRWEVTWTEARPEDLAVDGALTVPADHVYVLGDNRLAAMDSRTLGPVPMEAIVGCRWR